MVVQTATPSNFGTTTAPGGGSGVQLPTNIVVVDLVVDQ